LLDPLKGDVEGVAGQDPKVGPRPVQTTQSLNSLVGDVVPSSCFKEIDKSLEANAAYDDLRKSIVMKPFVIGSDHVLVIGDG